MEEEVEQSGKQELPSEPSKEAETEAQEHEVEEITTSNPEEKIE